MIQTVGNAIKAAGKALQAAVTESSEMATERLAVCQQCPLMEKRHRRCLACGCFVDLKVKLQEESCPHDQW